MADTVLVIFCTTSILSADATKGFSATRPLLGLSIDAVTGDETKLDDTLLAKFILPPFDHGPGLSLFVNDSIDPDAPLKTYLPTAVPSQPDGLPAPSYYEVSNEPHLINRLRDSWNTWEKRVKRYELDAARRRELPGGSADSIEPRKIARLVGLPKNDDPVEVSDLTWTGLLNDLSRQGFPLAHRMRLVAWATVGDEIGSSLHGKDVFLAPNFGAELGQPADTDHTPSDGSAPPELKLFYKHTVLGEECKIELRITGVTLDSSTSWEDRTTSALGQNAIGAHSNVVKRDWLATITADLANAIDPFTRLTNASSELKVSSLALATNGQIDPDAQAVIAVLFASLRPSVHDGRLPMPGTRDFSAAHDTVAWAIWDRLSLGSELSESDRLSHLRRLFEGSEFSNEDANWLSAKVIQTRLSVAIERLERPTDNPVRIWLWNPTKPEEKVARIEQLESVKMHHFIAALRTLLDDPEVSASLFLQAWDEIAKQGSPIRDAMQKLFPNVGLSNGDQPWLDRPSLRWICRDAYEGFSYTLSDHLRQGLAGTFWSGPITEILAAVPPVVVESVADTDELVRFEGQELIYPLWTRLCTKANLSILNPGTYASSTVETWLPELIPPQARTLRDSALRYLAGEPPDSVGKFPMEFRQLAGLVSTKLIPLAAPHPLLVPLPSLAPDGETAGWVILARRKMSATDAPPWRCLNLACRRVHAGADFVDLQTKTLLPLPLTETDGLTQTLLRYEGHPLIGDHATTHELPDAGKQAALDLKNEPCKCTKLDWAQIPRLRYCGEGESYDFAFVPAHKTGYLPGRFHPVSEPGWSESLLPSFEDELWRRGDLFRTPASTSLPYKRRTRINRVRLAGATEKPASKSPSLIERKNPLSYVAYADANLPLIPPGVFPLASELDHGPTEDRHTTAFDDSADQPGNKASRLPTNAPAVILLREKNQPFATSKFSLRIRPPSTDFEDWLRWVWPATRDDASIKAVNEVICDYTSLVDKAQTDPEPEAERTEKLLSDWFDDPAIGGVLIEMTRIYPPTGADPLSHRTILAADTTAGGPFVRIKKHRQDFGDFTIERHDGASRWTSTANLLQIAPEEVWELNFVPLVDSESCKRFDEKYHFEKVGNTRWHLTPHSGFRLRAEATPLSLTEKFGDNPTAAQHALWLEQLLPEKHGLWRALQAQSQPPTGTPTGGTFRLQVSLRSDALDRNWAMAGCAQLMVQSWRWNGLPQKGQSLAAALGAEEPNLTAETFAKMMAAARPGEAAGFANRDHDDVEVFQRRISLGRYFNARGVQPDGSESSLNELLTRDDSGHSALPDYLRLRVRVFSRYATPDEQGLSIRGLPEFRDAVVESRTGSAEFPQDPYRRLIIPAVLPDRLAAPRIKLVIPLLDPLDSHERPGFFALSRDPLPSPFHQLRAVVEIAELDLNRADGITSDTERILRSPEFAPDPVTSRMPIFVPKDNAPPAKVEFKPAEAFGLSFEREAPNPLFPNAGYYFDFPAVTQKAATDGSGNQAAAMAYTGDWIKRHDIFTQLRFHWEIAPPGVTAATPASWLSGELSARFHLRFLSPFSDVVTADKDKAIMIDNLRFDLSPDGELQLFDDGGNSVRIKPVDPSAQDPGNHGDLPPTRREFIFICWESIPDFLTGSPARRPTHIFGSTSNGGWKEIWSVGANDRAGEVQLSDSAQGQLMLCQVMDSLGSPGNIPDLWNSVFFPSGEDNGSGGPTISKEAQGVVLRISKPIQRKS